VARLSTSERSALSDRAFAYVDSRGNRRLPIHDASHVRNALARFGRVDFESLLQAARKFRIVPVGFIANEIEVAQRPKTAAQLPSGFVTMLMTDIEGSTALVHEMGPRFGQLIDEVWAALRMAVAGANGIEVEARADEFFAVFEAPRGAVEAAIAMQRAFAGTSFVDGVPVRIRVGIHSGYPTRTADNYVGIDVNATSRITSLGHGQQIVVSANTREAVKASGARGVRFVTLGTHALRGFPESVALYQIGADGLPSRFPPLRT
jgi:class 3 adenylate cyclase